MEGSMDDFIKNCCLNTAPNKSNFDNIQGCSKLVSR